MATDPAVRDHQTWLGYLQPDGLVVSAAALVDAQVVLDRNTLPLQQRFLPFVKQVPVDGETVAALPDIPRFVEEFLGWPAACLYGLEAARPLPDSVTIPLPEFNETLAPTFAFRDPRPKDDTSPWLLLVQTHPIGTDLNAAVTGQEAGWSASRARRFDRLLRETRVAIGVLANGTEIRLVYAPHEENSGSLTFPVDAMAEVAGRPILGALHLLLDNVRLLAAPTEARLHALLVKSREYQSRVSSALAQQVLDSLYELLRGLQAANERTKGQLLRETLARNPDTVYHGLLTVLMRLVFLLFAEDRGLLPTTALYARHYSIHGLFERLRVDQEHYPDTMDHRYGAWAQLLALFRAVHHGAKHPQIKLPARSGYLFDPARFPFLEGRTCAEPRLPLISDGTIYRVLASLLLLDGERLSYRTLDVEEIGSVYQTVMGFRLSVATGPSIAIIGKRKHKGEVPAATVINLEELRTTAGEKRAKWLADKTDQELSAEAAKLLKAANDIDSMLAALDRKIARGATPHPVPLGGLVLQPTDERRRSGSHYTPRSLTRPIVQTSLRPILQRLEPRPTPDQILALKVCDIAMGSGAFLVETCRQLGDELVKAWHAYGSVPVIPADEDEILHARRLIAQSCLYGVDRNPMAVDLAKLSLWLTTLAKEHPFTFLDHSLRAGDSLVGLTKAQIAGFHWQPTAERVFGQDRLERKIERVSAYRREILAGGDMMPPSLKRHKLDLADEALQEVREAGDLVVAAFFAADKDKARIEQRNRYLDRLARVLQGDVVEAVRLREVAAELQASDFPVMPFHWQVEFPEVFDRGNAGFDAIVGNPPFLGGMLISSVMSEIYREYLYETFPEAGNRMDLVAYFFRRSFALLREGGTFGLVATNTISQGDTRSGGLRYICSGGGTIYAARKRFKWPGQASVIVSIIWVTRGDAPHSFTLNDRPVPTITAYLFHAGTHDDPVALKANIGRSFKGSVILGMGFTFDDTDTKHVASSLSEMRRVISTDPKNAELIFPFIGGEEFNNSPVQLPHRYVINFRDMTEDDARKWPELFAIVERKVKPARTSQNREAYRNRWWQYAEKQLALYEALRGMNRVLAIPETCPHYVSAFLPTRYVFAQTLYLLLFESFAAFAAFQSRPKEIWTRFFGSSMKDDLRYTPSDCFETFPFPRGFETDTAVERAGREYYEFRAALMLRNNEGLTKTYNRFHNPGETSSDILQLRRLHADMDATILSAYGWRDLASRSQCEFLLDYEDDDEEEEDGRIHKRKRPWRYRWSDDVRDEVLARLIKLNAERAEEERAAGDGEVPLPGGKGRASAARTAEASGQQAFLTCSDGDRQ